MSAAKRSGWYSIEIALLCQMSGCRKGATREVFNRFNSPVGRYCTRHAERRLNQSDMEYVPPRKHTDGSVPPVEPKEAKEAMKGKDK